MNAATIPGGDDDGVFFFEGGFGFSFHEIPILVFFSDFRGQRTLRVEVAEEMG